MFTPSQTRSLLDSFTALQNRIAAGFRTESREQHQVLVSVSISDRSGNVIQTIEPAQKSNSRYVGNVSDIGQFATGIALSTPTRRIAAMFEVAAYVFSLYGDDGLVVSATYQDTVAFSNTTMDYVAQAFMKDGKLVTKEVQVADRS